MKNIDISILLLFINFDFLSNPNVIVAVCTLLIAILNFWRAERERKKNETKT